MIRVLFPPGADYDKLQITEEGKYSVSFYKDAQNVCNTIKKYVGINITITDATACNGGDTIMFAKNFKSVNSVEMNPDNYAVLENNVGVYGLTNVKLYNKDYNDCTHLQQDVLYFDPPWGGPEYSKQSLIDVLYVGVTPIENFIEMPELQATKLFVYKLPKNYNTSRLKKLGGIVQITRKKNGEEKYKVVYVLRK
jgi:hypothetical protein